MAGDLLYNRWRNHGQQHRYGQDSTDKRRTLIIKKDQGVVVDGEASASSQGTGPKVKVQDLDLKGAFVSRVHKKSPPRPSKQPCIYCIHTDEELRDRKRPMDNPV